MSVRRPLLIVTSDTTSVKIRQKMDKTKQRPPRFMLYILAKICANCNMQIATLAATKQKVLYSYIFKMYTLKNMYLFARIFFLRIIFSRNAQRLIVYPLLVGLM